MFFKSIKNYRVIYEAMYKIENNFKYTNDGDICVL